MQALPEMIFVTGIGTGVGKTLACAVLTEALQADYWKPVQCGNLDDSDSKTIKRLVTNPISKILPEAYRFQLAASPHYAAKAEGEEIKIADIELPLTSNKLLIEGAGGLFVPLSENELMIDFIKHFKLPVVLVVRNYLGSINHTLLSIEAIKRNGVQLLGVIFSGGNFLDNEQIIQHFGNCEVLGKIDEATEVNQNFISGQAQTLKASLKKHFQF